MKKSKFFKNRILPYLLSLIMIVLVTIMGLNAIKFFGPMNLDMFYLLIVVFSAVRWGRGPAVMASIVSVLAFNYFFVSQYFSIAGFDLQSAFILVGFLIVGLLVSALASKTREQALEASQREMQVTMLYLLSKDLAAADSLDEVLQVIRTNVGKIFNCQVAVFILTDHKLELSSVDPGFPVNDQEKLAAQRAIKDDYPAGSSVESIKFSKSHYLPLKTAQGNFGVLGISYPEAVSHSPNDDHMLIALASQSAIAIQRTKLAEVSRQIELLRETEKLQTALLNSISHDLRTPLVSIMGVLDSLLNDFSSLDQQTREELLASAYENSDHLNRLVSNLLDMTRLEAKALKVNIEPCELRDVIGASLRSLKDAVVKRQIMINIPDDFPEVRMDFVLMMHVFINLVDNAVKYSPPETSIKISAKLLKDQIKIDVKDEGMGIPEEDLLKVFDKFYRAFKPRQITGTGLGLSICKGIIEVHGGEIFAKNNPVKGVTVSVVLPLTAQEGHQDGQ